MKSNMFIQVLAIALIIVIIVNFVGWILGKVQTRTFWIVIIFCGASAYWGIPQLRKKLGKK